MIMYLFNKMILGIMTVMMMMVKMTVVVEVVRKCHHFDRVCYSLVKTLTIPKSLPSVRQVPSLPVVQRWEHGSQVNLPKVTKQSEEECYGAFSSERCVAPLLGRRLGPTAHPTCSVLGGPSKNEGTDTFHRLVS